MTLDTTYFNTQNYLEAAIDKETGGFKMGSTSQDAANTARTTATKVQPVQHIDESGVVGGVTETTLHAGEDLTNDVTKVEQRFSYSMVAADAAVKSGAGFLHTLTFSCNDAAPTAGSIIVYDNTAESGTVIFNHTFTTTPFMPVTVILDVVFTTGLYVGFTTTADVNCTISYR